MRLAADAVGNELERGRPMNMRQKEVLE